MLREQIWGARVAVIFFSGADEQELSSVAQQLGAHHVCKADGVPRLLEEIARRYPELIALPDE